jgi:hypothetical protein
MDYVTGRQADTVGRNTYTLNVTFSVHVKRNVERYKLTNHIMSNKPTDEWLDHTKQKLETAFENGDREKLKQVVKEIEQFGMEHEFRKPK